MHLINKSKVEHTSREFEGEMSPNNSVSCSLNPKCTLVGVVGLVGVESSLSGSLEMVTNVVSSWAADATCASQSPLLDFFKWANFGLVAS